LPPNLPPEMIFHTPRAAHGDRTGHTFELLRSSLTIGDLPVGQTAKQLLLVGYGGSPQELHDQAVRSRRKIGSMIHPKRAKFLYGVIRQ
jgi:hypothetical protein